MSTEAIVQLVGGLLLLILAGETLVKGASELAAALGIPPMIIGLTVVAFGTSAPELAVSLNAAFRANADIAVANVVGSNIFNTLLILGASALISPLVIHSQMIKREVPLLVFVSLLVLIVSLDGSVSRLEGFGLFLGILTYTGWLVRESLVHRRENRELVRETEKEFGKLNKDAWSGLRPLVLTVGGLAGIIWGADWLVAGAIQSAKYLGVEDRIIGLTIVSMGTSLPELVASLMATVKGERDLAVGNVIGSNLFNILAILGLAGTIAPAALPVQEALKTIDIPIMVAAAVICWPFFKTGSQLSRGEGAFFLVAYTGYLGFMILYSS